MSRKNDAIHVGFTVSATAVAALALYHASIKWLQVKRSKKFEIESRKRNNILKEYFRRQSNSLFPEMVPLNEQREKDSGSVEPRMLSCLHPRKQQNSNSPKHCHLQPTIVIIHGFGCTSLEFQAVIDKMTNELQVNVFSYDRILFVKEEKGTVYTRNTRRSVLRPRTVTNLVQELHAILKNRCSRSKKQGDPFEPQLDSPPYILIGHSYGGLIARQYAATYPQQVLGLVLIDPAHPNQLEAFPVDFVLGFKVFPMLFKLYEWLCRTGMSKLLFRFMDAVGLFNFPPLFLFPSPPPSLFHTSSSTFDERSVALEMYSDAYDGIVWNRVSAELRGCMESFLCMKNQQQQHPKPSRDEKTKEEMQPDPSKQLASLQHPCALVLANHRRYSPTLFPHKVTDAFLHLHQELIANNITNPWKKQGRAKLFLANASDHWVHLQQPDLIVEALRHVMTQIQEMSLKKTKP